MHAWVALGLFYVNFIFERWPPEWLVEWIKNWIGLSLMRTGRSYTDIILWIIYFMWFFLKLRGLAWFVHKCLAWVNIQKLCTVGQRDLVNSAEAKQSSFHCFIYSLLCCGSVCGQIKDMSLPLGYFASCKFN